MKSDFTKIALFLITIFFLVSCGNSLDDMLDNYNKNFSGGSAEVSKSEIESIFDEKEMLFDSYVVSQIATLNLAAPYSFSEYKWTIQDPEGGSLDPVTVNTSFGTTDTSRKYTLYLPTSRLSAGKTYRLCLSVTDGMGEKYEDYATLAVYNDYFFSTGIVTIPPSANASKVASPSLSVKKASSVAESSARSILPSSYEVTGLKYFMYAKDLRTDTVVIQDVTSKISPDSADSKKGYLSFDLEKSSYFITLLALKTAPDPQVAGQEVDAYFDDLKKQAVLIGFSTFDNRYNQGALFNMEPNNSSEVKGSVELTLYTDGWNVPSGYSAKVTLGNLAEAEKDVELSSEQPASANYSYEVSAGNYELKVSVSDSTNTFAWTDRLTVIPGSKTSATIKLPNFVKTTGIAKFKIYKNGWSAEDLAKYTFGSVAISDSAGNSVAEFTENTALTAESLTDSLPAEINYSVTAESGNYVLTLTFTTADSKIYVYKKDFEIKANSSTFPECGISVTDLEESP